MNCQDFDKKLGLYAYHDLIPDHVPVKLPKAEHAAMTEHARSCARCGGILRARKLRQCREIIDAIADYLDGAMPADERGTFEMHLSVCPACVAYIESYKQTLALGKDAFEAASSPAAAPIPEDLVKAVLAARKKPGKS